MTLLRNDSKWRLFINAYLVYLPPPSVYPFLHCKKNAASTFKIGAAFFFIEIMGKNTNFTPTHAVILEKVKIKIDEKSAFFA